MTARIGHMSRILLQPSDVDPHADHHEPTIGDSHAPPWMRRVPLITGALAALAGFLTVRAANLANDAVYQSSQATLFQSQASDKWAEYQADSVKARVVETALLVEASLAPAARATLAAQSADLRKRQPAAREDASTLLERRDAALVGGKARLAEKDLTDYAAVAAQLGIALASVAALTRRSAAFTAGVVAGLIAVLVTGYALLVHLHTHT